VEESPCTFFFTRSELHESAIHSEQRAGYLRGEAQNGDVRHHPEGRDHHQRARHLLWQVGLSREGGSSRTVLAGPQRGRRDQLEPTFRAQGFPGPAVLKPGLESDLRSSKRALGCKPAVVRILHVRGNLSSSRLLFFDFARVAAFSIPPRAPAGRLSSLFLSSMKVLSLLTAGERASTVEAVREGPPRQVVESPSGGQSDCSSTRASSSGAARGEAVPATESGGSGCEAGELESARALRAQASRRERSVIERDEACWGQAGLCIVRSRGGRPAALQRASAPFST